MSGAHSGQRFQVVADPERGDRTEAVARAIPQDLGLEGSPVYTRFMAVTLEDGLRALDEASELAKAIRIELDDAYLAAIARVESLAQNQSGADKTWVTRATRAFDRHFAEITRVR